jgi:acyl-CoA dehydrogenase
MSVVDLPARSLAERARVAAEVAAAHADDVDREARFPHEAIEALRADGLLSLLVAPEDGGEGASVGQVAEVVEVLGRACASTSMIYAMHQIQVACLVRHGSSRPVREYLRRVASEGLLLASATTELGIGGDVRSSSCAVERDGGRFRLSKASPVISYGEHADGVLATARRDPDSPPSDQVLVVCRRPDLELERLSEWDTLGFRGTCSNGFQLTAEGDEAYVLDTPYAEISSQTMLPTSHVVWGSVWLGIATESVDRARRFVQKEARKKPGTLPPAAMHLAELVALHQQFSELVHGAARRYDAVAGDPDALASMGFAIGMNALKVSASELVVEVVRRAMTIIGITAYRNDSDLSLARLQRDAHGAALMVNNDRINANNAQLLLVHRGAL